MLEPPGKRRQGTSKIDKDTRSNKARLPGILSKGKVNIGNFRFNLDIQARGLNNDCMTCKDKNITQTMVNCSMYVCDVHFLLIWLLLTKNYTANNLIKVWH